MWAVELIVGLLAFALLFIALKILGLVFKLALLIAAAGFVAGFFATYAFRSGRNG
jgi:hypothetical protein